jgi:Family of unknown function (DUF6062)
VENRSVSLDGHHCLVEACARPGCPVCGCLRDTATRHLAAVLAEHVTDPVSRARLAAASGFCAAHATALSEMPEAALGTAIVYHALVEQASRWLEESARTVSKPERRRGWRSLVGRRSHSARESPARRARCPVCVELVAAEACYLDGLLEGLATPELWRAYASSDGLCLPHLDLAVTRGGPRSETAPLIALTRDKLRALAEDLRQFVDKHDHRVTRPRFTDREADAWRRALALLAGRMELFGPEMERDRGRNTAPTPRLRRMS